MTWPLEEVHRLVAVTGRCLLRVGVAGDNEIELVFERVDGEDAEILVTVSGPVQFGEVDLDAMEASFGRRYGLGVPG